MVHKSINQRYQHSEPVSVLLGVQTLARHPNRRLALELLTILLVEVPAPHGRWSLRLVKHSRLLATHP